MCTDSPLAPHQDVPFSWPNNERGCSLKPVMRDICPAPCSQHHLLHHPSQTSPRTAARGQGLLFSLLIPSASSSLQPTQSSQGALDTWTAVPYPPLYQHQASAEASQVFWVLGLGSQSQHQPQGRCWCLEEECEEGATPCIHKGKHGRYCNTWWEMRQEKVERSSEGNAKSGAG